ncbi:fimbrial protein [Yersinia kristensenii]|uniref:fimbrial protein n=1 Tax=Yersinia kristensenii TaxID=28152 RepID=UPI001C609FC0|nr:fimbrial protein [Yersinia kristensenii]MBW5816673.1 fimbrial protein [Yersinia kristensenii]MBW5841548.1 fimbrial protein [Yersinia kristensenii]MDA5489318.1 fimbrial protein [Yersinia kristensenii]
MKKKNTQVAIAITFAFVTTVSSFSTFADDLPTEPTPGNTVSAHGGTIKFMGSLVDAPCAVDTPTDGQIVDLGQYRTAGFTDVGMTSPAKRFDIKLSDCAVDTYKKAHVTFNGLSAGENTTLALDGGTSAAKGIGIQILSNGKPLPVDASAASDDATLVPGDTKMIFQARYVSIDKTVKPGAANASVDFTITYL